MSVVGEIGNDVSAGKHLEAAQRTRGELCPACGRCAKGRRDWVPAIVVAVLLLVALAPCGVVFTLKMHALQDGIDRCERNAAYFVNSRHEGVLSPKEPSPDRDRKPPSPVVNHEEKIIQDVVAQNETEVEEYEDLESADNTPENIFTILASLRSRESARLKRSAERRRDRRQGTGPESTTTPTRHKNKCPRRCRRCCIKGDQGEKGDKGDPGPPGQMALAAALYQGNVGRYDVPEEDYDPNNIPGERIGCDHANIRERTFRSCDGKLQHWEKAPWMTHPDHARYYDNKFRLNWDGQVQVTEAGLYYLFGQIMFYNAAPFNTAGIDVKGRSIVRCTHSVTNVNQGGTAPTYQTCSMGTIWYLERNDNVRMVVKQGNRVIDMQQDTTFFGLVKLADAPEVVTSATRPPTTRR
ncbi:ectodysplasin-A isoform X2 [Lingula anatina]|uniref:Ectodysplasin-A isoform X2 n=1 Tax=Lingula anatina TaxID=7574 RepID=A0A1S3IL71_LINAN|nr:ectodysplasin-A isoform X2 [Lingula anatina]|eukprot:XP_013398967.1 ectodysplasin-A isoform X2 [Lingula anatina]